MPAFKATKFSASSRTNFAPSQISYNSAEYFTNGFADHHSIDRSDVSTNKAAHFTTSPGAIIATFCSTLRKSISSTINSANFYSI